MEWTNIEKKGGKYMIEVETIEEKNVE